MIFAHWAIWTISLLCLIGILFRPFRWPEAVWASGAAVLLIAFGLLSTHDAWSGVLKGVDVYLFLSGMMLMAESAREQKLFDWLAALACREAKGSPQRLFLLIYLVGTLVTILMSNDATAVVLTPAVAIGMKRAKIEKPLPYLFICAFIANAASFVLPVSNPANLVIYGARLPSLLKWIPLFFLPSLVSVVSTFFLLKWTQKDQLQSSIAELTSSAPLGAGGKISGWGIVIMTVVLLTCSGFRIPLGLPTLLCGLTVTIAISANYKKSPITTFRTVSWSVIPLVAGLFVLVEALNQIGVVQTLSSLLGQQLKQSASLAAWKAGGAVALASNVVNNLPAGLLSGTVLQSVDSPAIVQGAVLVGIDLGPNLSVTGSLATILWLVALRREGIEVGAWEFLKLGILIMLPALLLTLASLIYL